MVTSRCSPRCVSGLAFLFLFCIVALRRMQLSKSQFHRGSGVGAQEKKNLPIWPRHRTWCYNGHCDLARKSILYSLSSGRTSAVKRGWLIKLQKGKKKIQCSACALEKKSRSKESSRPPHVPTALAGVPAPLHQTPTVTGTLQVLA